MQEPREDLGKVMWLAGVSPQSSLVPVASLRFCSAVPISLILLAHFLSAAATAALALTSQNQ